jgi:hypothetical protein
MAGVERAVWGGPPEPRTAFYGLARSRGFTERECVIAAATGRLTEIVACPVVEQRGRGGQLSGAQALSRLHELRARLQDARLRDAGLI